MTGISVTAETAGRRASVIGARLLPVAALGAVAVAAVWRERGSIAIRDWAAYGLVAGLVLAVVAASRAALAPTRQIAVAAAALFALAACDAASLAWTASPSLGRDEALLTILFATVLLVPVLALGGALERVAATGLVVAALGAVAVATACKLILASDAASVYVAGRLHVPIAYPNAQAAFFLVGVWPALALTARRNLPVAVRALALGAAAALSGGWALAQSKGGALGLAVSMLVVFGVSRRRLRLAVPVALTAALTAAAFTTLTGPFRADGGAALAAIHRAGLAELLLGAAGALTGTLYAYLDRRLTVPERLSRTLGTVVVTALVATVAGGCTLFFARTDDPGDFFAARWESFKHLPDGRTSSTHLGELGSNRYDFWRVALHDFAGHPIVGIGTRGFRASYLQQRHSPESPARSHSIELDALSETGIVGLGLLGLALGAAVAAFARRARDDLVALGALGAFACWLTHASVDWTWTFPGIGIALFLVLGIAAARADAPPLRARIGRPLAAAATVLALGGFGLPWLSAHYVRAALAGTGSPGADLSRARSLDPISLDPLRAAWALAPTARAGIPPLQAAVRQEPRSPDLLYVLGRQQVLAGDRVAGRKTLERALRLDPGDPAIEAELERAR